MKTRSFSIIANADYIRRWRRMWSRFGYCMIAGIVLGGLTILLVAVSDDTPGVSTFYWRLMGFEWGMICAAVVFAIGLFGACIILIRRRLRYKIWTFSDDYPDWA